MRIFLATFLALSAGTSLAQTRSQVWGSPLTQKTQTLYVSGEESMTTYDSQAADSKETRPSTTYSLGGWAGEARTVGMSYTSNDANVPFSLNGAQMHTSFKDVRAMARLGYVIPSVGVSLSEVNLANKDGQKTIGLYGTGVNAGLELAIPIAAFLVVSADAFAVASNEIYDKLNQGTTLGKRIDGNVCAAYDLTEKTLELLVGYRYRQYDLTEPTVNYTERSQGAYAGLRLGVYF